MSPNWCFRNLKKPINTDGLPLAEIARGIGAELEGDSDILVSSVAPIEEAQAGQISFVANPGYAKHIQSTNASALVLDLKTPCDRCAVLRHENPYFAFAQVLDILYSAEQLVKTGIHTTAFIEESAQISPEAAVGPFCHVSDNAKIGSGTQLVSSVFLGNNVEIGDNCIIYPGVKIMDDSIIGDRAIIHASTVVGSDGFGFAEHSQGLKKVKQIGWVEIGNDVEIGSNCSVDRGALGPTRIGNSVKIDNLVQIAHNVQVGDYSILVGQCGIAGSTKLGKGVIIAAQAGVVGHIELGNGVKVAGQSGVSKSLSDGSIVFGSPAREIGLAKRIEAAMSRLPELFKRVRKLEKQNEPD